MNSKTLGVQIGVEMVTFGLSKEVVMFVILVLSQYQHKIQDYLIIGNIKLLNVNDSFIKFNLALILQDENILVNIFNYLRNYIIYH